MTPEQFRQHGHEVVDWIADYWTRIGSLPVRSTVAPGDVRAALPAAPPEQGEPFADVLADLDRVVVPGLTHWQHPGFFGYFPANTSGPSVLGDLVSAGLGVQGMSWVTSPAATELEQHVMDWFAELLGLPESFRSTGTGGGVVQDSSSGANLVALLAALHRSQRRRHRPPRRGARAGHRLRVGRDPLLDGEGGPHRRAGQRRRPHRRGRRRPGHGPRRARGPAGARRGPRATRPCWSAPRWARRRPPPSTRWPRSARSARSTACGCTSTPPTPVSAPSSPSCAACRTASSGPTATPPTRTSGCSPASTPPCSGSPTAPP